MNLYYMNFGYIRANILRYVRVPSLREEPLRQAAGEPGGIFTASK